MWILSYFGTVQSHQRNMYEWVWQWLPRFFLYRRWGCNFLQPFIGLQNFESTNSKLWFLISFYWFGCCLLLYWFVKNISIFVTCSCIYIINWSECSDGYYGEECSSSCGRCLNDSACQHITGVCDQGCEPGYQTPNCTQGILVTYKFC